MEVIKKGIHENLINLMKENCENEVSLKSFISLASSVFSCLILPSHVRPFLHLLCIMLCIIVRLLCILSFIYCVFVMLCSSAVWRFFAWWILAYSIKHNNLFHRQTSFALPCCRKFPGNITRMFFRRNFATHSFPHKESWWFTAICPTAYNSIQKCGACVGNSGGPLWVSTKEHIMFPNFYPRLVLAQVWSMNFPVLKVLRFVSSGILTSCFSITCFMPLEVILFIGFSRWSVKCRQFANSVLLLLYCCFYAWHVIAALLNRSLLTRCKHLQAPWEICACQVFIIPLRCVAFACCWLSRFC